MPLRVLLLFSLLACRPTADTAAPNDRHVVPKGLVHVVFHGVDDAPAERLPLHEALAVRAATDAEHRATYLDRAPSTASTATAASASLTAAPPICGPPQLHAPAQ